MSRTPERRVGVVAGGLSPEHQTLIRVIYEAFREAGEWPTYQYVDHTLDSAYSLDLATLLTGLPEGLLWPDPRRTRRVISASDRMRNSQ